jgi:glucose-6-phosphate isomerase
MNSLLDATKLLAHIDLERGTVGDAPLVQRRLSDLRGCYRDPAAYEALLADGNPLVYSVSGVEPAAGAGDLHYGVGVIHPGVVGDEYFLTKGHLHTWRDAAEVYVGLAGEGAMLLEDEATGESRLLPLAARGVVYVPGHTAHRTVNTGDVPLVYIGIYPARAGHDYGALAEKNFRQVVVKRDGKPTLMERGR